MSDSSNRLVLLLSLGFLLFSCAANSKTPVWVKKEPTDPLFYSTVVKVSKQGTLYKERAFETALKNISMQITVTVDASVTTRETEAFGLTASDFNSSIQTSSRAQLSGVELAGSHETKKEYWAWYRLNKEAFRSARQMQCDTAVRTSLDQLSKFDAALQEASVDFSISAGFLIFALDQLSDFLDLDLRATYQGKEIQLYSELVHRVAELSAKTRISLDPTRMTAVARRPSDLRSKIDCRYAHKESGQAVTALPLLAQFSKGTGDLSANLTSNQFGTAELIITRVTAFDASQLITVKVDKELLIGMSGHPLVRKLLKGLNFSSASLELEVRRPRVWVSSQTNQQENVSVPLIEDRLRELEVEVTQEQGNSDYILRVEIESNPGSYIPNLKLYSAQSNARLSLIDAVTGTTLGSESLISVKGTGPNPETAIRNSEQTSLKAISQDTLYLLISNHIIGF